MWSTSALAKCQSPMPNGMWRTKALTSRIAVPCGTRQLHPSCRTSFLGPRLEAPRRSGPTPCNARPRKGNRPDVSEMNLDQKLERLGQLSGRVGKTLGPFDRENILREMGVMDPALYALEAEEEVKADDEEEGEDWEPEWIDWVDDATVHNVNMTELRTLPDGIRQRLVVTEAVEEGEALVQVPLHNCLVLYYTDDLAYNHETLSGEDALEREVAVQVFEDMQKATLLRWIEYHGPMPKELVEMLCDFSPEAPSSRFKMAIWVLWVAEACESPYWQQAMAAMIPPEDMPNLEFCTPAEVAELQWLPQALPVGIRREALKSFWTDFSESELAVAMGFHPILTTEEEALVEEAFTYAIEQGTASIAAQERAERQAAADKAARTAKAAAKLRARAGETEEEPAPEPEPEPAPVDVEKLVDEMAEKYDIESIENLRPLKPMPSFERFLWAYCHAEARTMSNGERLVFFPQADPVVYTNAHEQINCTLTVLEHPYGILDHFAVLAADRALTEGEPVFVRPPFGAGPDDGGGGTTTQLHEQFGLVPDPGGCELDIMDLEPENGGLTDEWLKQILGQAEASRFDQLEDPGLRHLIKIALSSKENLDLSQIPPVRLILPKLQLARLWGPGVVAGVRSLRLVQISAPLVTGEKAEDEEDEEGATIAAGEQDEEGAEIAAGEQDEEGAEIAAGEQDEEGAEIAAGEQDEEDEDDAGAASREELLAALRWDEELAERMAAARGGDPPPEVSYSQSEEWRNDLVMTEIVEVPEDTSLLQSPEGWATWRRMRAAWGSLPRQTPSTKEHGRCMKLAVEGAPIEEVFTTPRDMRRELTAVDSVLGALKAILASFATTIEEDEELLASAGPSPAAPATAAAPAATTAASPEEPTSGKTGRKKSGGQKSATGSGSDSESDDSSRAASTTASGAAGDDGEGSEAAGADGEGTEASTTGAEEEIDPAEVGEPITAVDTLRRWGVVAWRLEQKRVWRYMIAFTEEYRESLAAAVAAAGLGADDEEEEDEDKEAVAMADV